MVAISLYRGKLHRTPDAPRQWLMPTPKISLKDFKTLLHRRSRALSRLQSTATTSNPNPHTHDSCTQQTQPDGSSKVIVEKALKVDGDRLIDEFTKPNDADEEVNGQKRSKADDDDNCLVIPSDELVEAVVADAKAVVPENETNAAGDDLQQEEKTQNVVEHQSEPLHDDTLSDKEKRKKEVEEKLQVLNARKHNLVQVLKQILKAEEELRSRSNMQGSAGRPSVSLQVDVTTNDSGSMSRHVTPRPASEGNCIGDTEGADADDGSNQNMHSRSVPRTSSISPSSDSFHRKTPSTTVANGSRATLGIAASSPSRFGPSGNAGSLPTVSVTGTNYVASSPSPAGSGGTSVFRDARLPSPWN